MGFLPHALVQFGGTLAALSGPSEIWSCGIRVTKPVPGGGGGYLDDPQAVANALAGPLATWFGTAANGMSADASLKFLKVNNIDPNGHYADSSTHQAASITRSGGGTPVAPSFCSIALTLESNVSRGHAHRGRIYLPNYCYTPIGAQISSADVAKVLAAGKALLTLLQSPVAGSVLTTPVICSKLGAGTTRVIDHLSVDNVYDYQSRRKDRLSATRTTGSAY